MKEIGQGARRRCHLSEPSWPSTRSTERERTRHEEDHDQGQISAGQPGGAAEEHGHPAWRPQIG